MDFLEKVTETITQAGKTAGEKFKQVNERSTLAGQIQAEQKAIEEAYRTVGMGFVHAHMDDEVVLYSEQILAVKRALANIDEMKTRLKTLHGVTACAKCGGEIPPEASFCPACGTHFAAQELPATQTAPFTQLEETPSCAGCGAEVDETSQFCPYCGMYLNPDEPETAE